MISIYNPIRAVMAGDKVDIISPSTLEVKKEEKIIKKEPAKELYMANKDIHIVIPAKSVIKTRK